MSESSENDKNGDTLETDKERKFTPRYKGDRKNKTGELKPMDVKPEITMISLDDLIAFENHPFTLYEGQRFDDMVESIKVNGVIQPVIVRPHPTEKGKYEILSGHNRVEAAKVAEVKSIHVIIREGLTDEEALFIVTETNLIQRSFTDMKHSERAVVLATHYATMKKNPGYRSDLLEEIETLTGSPVANRKRTMDKLGEQHGLSKDTIARYLRVNELVSALKERLNKDEISMRVAVSLSYLRDTEQKIVDSLIGKGTKVNMTQGEMLRKESANGKLDKAAISELLKPKTSTTKTKSVKLSDDLFSRHFKDGQSAEEIEDVIAKALEMYHSNQE